MGRKRKKGPINPNNRTKAKLTPDDIRWIRANVDKNGGTWTQKAIGEKYEIRRQTICHIVNWHTWTDIE